MTEDTDTDTDTNAASDDGESGLSAALDEVAATTTTTTADDVAAAQRAVRVELVRFVRALRRANADVPANAGLVGARALAAVGFDDRRRVHDALRAAVLTGQSDIEPFERLFPAFWRRLTGWLDSQTATETAAGESNDRGGGFGVTDETDAPAESSDADGTSGDDEDGTPYDRRLIGREGDTESDEEPTSTARYSPSGRSEVVDASTATTPGHGDVESAVRRLTGVLAGLPGRRFEPADRGRRIDARRALRRSYATGGVVTSLPRREPKPTAVNGVVLVDVSRSVLDVIDRTFLVSFLRACHDEWRSLRTFFFDTDVREVTAAFDESTVDDVYGALERAETAWGGGTRIGHALATLRQDYPHSVDRTSVVLVISDGLEMGDVDELETGIVWLSRRARTVLWLNPLAASRGYEPTCRGMATALPYVDGLFAFTDVSDVVELASQLERRGSTRLPGYELTNARRATTRRTR